MLSLNISLIFFGLSSSKLKTLLEEAFETYVKYPEIQKCIQADLLKYAREKKYFRLLDKEYESDDHPCLFELERAELNPENLSLKTGRRAMTAEALYAFVILQGAISSAENEMVYESISRHCEVREIILRINNGNFPCSRSITENIAKLSTQFYELVHQAQLADVFEERLDDFKFITMDSSFVKANSAWPTDSSLMLNLLSRVNGKGQNLAELSGDVLSSFSAWHMDRWLKEMKKLDFGIILAQGKKGAPKVRKGAYTRIYDIAQKAFNFLSVQLADGQKRLQDSIMLPSLKDRLKSLLEDMEVDLLKVLQIIEYSSRRILNEEKIDATEKVYSVIDPDAYMICKGQRDPVIGYRPNFVRSATGFITALHLEKGNPCDTAVYQSSLNQSIKNTGVKPSIVSCDDGYAAEKNYTYATQELKIELASFSGAKGKKITPIEVYQSDEAKAVRNDRSNVESTISVLKGQHGMDKMTRRGCAAVRSEMMSKILAFNFKRMILIRSRRLKDTAA